MLVLTLAEKPMLDLERTFPEKVDRIAVLSELKLQPLYVLAQLLLSHFAIVPTLDSFQISTLLCRLPFFLQRLFRLKQSLAL